MPNVPAIKGTISFKLGINLPKKTLLAPCFSKNFLPFSKCFGLKNQKQIIEIVESWFKNLVKRNNVKLVVIACNTASIASYKISRDLSNKHKVPVISMVDGISTCIQKNRELIEGKNVAIMATKYTIDSLKYFEIIHKYHPKKIINIVATQSEHSVTIGNCNLNAGKSLIYKELAKYRNEKIDTLILACTCFQLITSQIRKILGKTILFLDPAIYVSEQSKEILNVTQDKVDPELLIYSTSKTKKSTAGLDVSGKTFLHKMPKITNLTLER